MQVYLNRTLFLPFLELKYQITLVILYRYGDTEHKYADINYILAHLNRFGAARLLKPQLG